MGTTGPQLTEAALCRACKGVSIT